MAHRVILNPDAVLRGETIEAVMERVTSRVKPPSGAAAAPAARGRGTSKSGRRKAVARAAS
jgi:hypothetical protein